MDELSHADTADTGVSVSPNHTVVCNRRSMLNVTFISLATNLLKCSPKKKSYYSAEMNHCQYSTSVAFCLTDKIEHPPPRDSTTCGRLDLGVSVNVSNYLSLAPGDRATVLVQPSTPAVTLYPVNSRGNSLQLVRKFPLAMCHVN